MPKPHRNYGLMLLAMGAVAILGASHASSAPASSGADPSCGTSTPCITYSNTSNGAGINGTSATGIGVFGSSTSGDGTRGNTAQNSTLSGIGRSGVVGQDVSTDGGHRNFGVTAASNNGFGLHASSGYVGIDVSGGSSDGKFPALSIRANTTGGADLIDACGAGFLAPCPGGSAVFKVGRSGSVTISGSSSGSMVNATNAGAASAISGTANNANGVIGSTKKNSTSSSAAAAGVIGRDLSTSTTFNTGVAGTSALGFGVVGESMSGTGVAGSSNGSGVSGFTATGASFPYAVVGSCGCPTASVGFLGVAGFAGTNGTGVYGTGLRAVWADGNSNTQAALYVDQRGTAPLIIAHAGTNDVMSLDTNGNMILKGSLTQHGTPLVVTRTVTGANVLAFTARQTEPTIEDFGQAQLINGQSYVLIDRAFAATMDPRIGYLVFLTPAGDSRGLYVTNRTLNGFVVRENQGGHSTLAFDFRIVAHPLDATTQRLPLTGVVLRSGQPMAAPRPPPMLRQPKAAPPLRW